MDRQPVLIGDRLHVSPMVEGDRAALFAVASDREMWALHPMHDRWQQPVFDALFDQGMASGGALTVRLGANDAGRVVGSSRYDAFDPADGGVVEIGWSWLARDLWGGSYNAELKRLMLAHALGFAERVVFRVGEDNVRSRRAMEKIGGRLTEARETFPTPHGDVVHVVFEITRESFAKGPLMGDSAGA